MRSRTRPPERSRPERAAPSASLAVTPTRLEVAYQGPRRGADRAVLLAHGAGGDVDSPAVTTVADALTGAGIPSLRFRYPYRSAGRRTPDRPAVLDAATRASSTSIVWTSRCCS